ncbi:uncharacterized protein LOC117100441 [Anneissia japonica]|uniref:uncharacterized protein LOC117100441 n=1 Tax=Anneissia japonica TaxID=1529436 RepID=UPI001425B399|nr:uncharacterized protein LOC117100441 [Anneissia japonica]
MAKGLSATSDFIGRSDEQFKFVGRENQIKTLKKIFLNSMVGICSQQRLSTQAVLITGEPMIGKTRLAKEIGHQLVRDCHQTGVRLDAYFIELRRVTEFNTVLVRLSAALGMPPCSEYDIVTVFRKRTHHSLIIFDAAEHLSVDTSAEMQTSFLEFCTRIVTNTKTLLLITSRFRYRFFKIRAKIYYHRLEKLSPSESSNLLKLIAVNTDFTDETEEKIANFCAGIPLALEIAATVLEDNCYTPKELVKLLEKNRLDALSDENYSQEEQVRHVIKSSIDKLKEILRKEYVKLSYIPDSFNAEAVAHILEHLDGRSALAKRDVLIPLTTRSLVARDTLQDRFDIHDFLREFLSKELSSLPLEQLLSLRSRYCVFYGRLLQALAPVVEEDSCKELSLFTVELVNIQKLLHEAALCPTEDYKLFLDIAYKAEYLIINFLPRKESVEFYAACVRAAESRGPAMKKQLGLMLSGYGQVLGHAQTNYKMADEQYERAMKCLTPFGDSVDLAWLINHIGWIRYSNDQFDQALKEFKHAESILNRIPEDSEHDQYFRKRTMASVLSCLGLTYAAKGKLRRALEYHKRALVIRRKMWGNHPSIGSIYNNMSETYDRMGDHKTALETAKLGLQIKMFFKREPSTDIIDSLVNVANNTCNVDGDCEKAHKHIKQALKMRECLGGKHTDIANIYHCRGLVYKKQGNYSQALADLEDAYRIRDEMLGSHADTANSLFHLADVEMIKGAVEEALGHLHDCLKMRKEGLQDHNIGISEVLEKLGDLYLQKNDNTLAVEYWEATVDDLVGLRAELILHKEDDWLIKIDRNIKCVKEKIMRSIKLIRI